MENYVFMWGEENHNNYDLTPLLLNYGRKAISKFGIGLKNALVFSRNFYTEFYMPKSELRRAKRLGLEFYRKKSNLKKLINDSMRAMENVYHRAETLVNTDLRRLTDEEFFDVYIYYESTLGEIFTCYSITQPHYLKGFEELLFKFLDGRVEDVNAAAALLTKPDVKFRFDKSTDIFKSFDEIVNKESVKIDKSLIGKRIYTLVKTRSKERDKLISKLNPPKKILHVIDVLKEVARIRMEMRISWMIGLYYRELLFNEIKRRRKISRRELRAYDSDELDELVRIGKKLPKKKLEKRKIGFLKLMENGEIFTFEGKKAEKMFNELIGKLEDKKTLAGIVASPGYTVGRAIILSYKKSREHSSKIQKMEEGQIIVTEMTRPNIVEACEKAGAIVTDEGGITSHAAIVSRELGIPCIVGTSIATKVIKDGDYLEVDANRGIVRKLSKDEYEQKLSHLEKRKRKGEMKAKVKLAKLKKGYVFWFSEIGKEDVLTVGGKGANLGELYKFVDVPDGFCVSTNAYKEFIEMHGIDKKIKDLLTGISLDDPHKIELVSSKIRKIILSYEMPQRIEKAILDYYRELKAEKVSVRSSATAEDMPGASFAGQQDTYLNVSGERRVIDSVKKCWASLFTPRAIFYREKNGINHLDVLIGVVIQRMVDARYAGVMFTKDPIHKKYILIEVVQGLGEKLVSGKVTPNSYLVSIEGKDRIISKKEKFRFKRELLFEIAQIGKRIERHYNFPQDIEWAIDKNEKIYILQSRPITTL